MAKKNQLLQREPQDAVLKGIVSSHRTQQKRDKKKKKDDSKGQKKFDTVMSEFKDKALHSGSKKGPKVTNPKQAVAIAYSEKRRAGKKK